MLNTFTNNHSRHGNLKPKIFNKGARHYLHPKLAFLDTIECVLEYYPDVKTIVVSYDLRTKKVEYTDYTEKVYAKAVISNTVDYIIEVINNDYIKPTREQVRTNLKEYQTTTEGDSE